MIKRKSINGSDCFEKEIGLFYRLPGNHYIALKAEYLTVQPINGFRDLSKGHLEFFEKEIYPKYAADLIDDYAYYPRGRVLYREKDKRFIVYADKCLMTKRDKETILRLYGLPWRSGEATINTNARNATER